MKSKNSPVRIILRKSKNYLMHIAMIKKFFKISIKSNPQTLQINKKFLFGEKLGNKSKFLTFIKFIDPNKKLLNKNNKSKIKMAFLLLVFLALVKLLSSSKWLVLKSGKSKIINTYNNLKPKTQL